MSFTSKPLVHKQNSSTCVLHWTSVLSSTSCYRSGVCSVSFMPQPLSLSTSTQKSQGKSDVVRTFHCLSLDFWNSWLLTRGWNECHQADPHSILQWKHILLSQICETYRMHLLSNRTVFTQINDVLLLTGDGFYFVLPHTIYSINTEF